MDEATPRPDDDARVRARIASLREEHQDLDDAVRALEGLPMPDQLQIARGQLCPVAVPQRRCGCQLLAHATSITR